LDTVVKNRRLYEGLFLVDSAEAVADWDGITTLLKNIIEKSGGEILSLRKWDERKFAYPIAGKQRGTYILCYFKLDSIKLHTVEKDMRLSERVMRLLVLKADHMTQEDMDKETPAMITERLGTRPAEFVPVVEEPEPAQAWVEPIPDLTDEQI